MEFHEFFEFRNSFVIYQVIFFQMTKKYISYKYYIYIRKY